MLRNLLKARVKELWYNNILLEIGYSNFFKFKICCVQLEKLLSVSLTNSVLEYLLA